PVLRLPIEGVHPGIDADLERLHAYLEGIGDHPCVGYIISYGMLHLPPDLVCFYGARCGSAYREVVDIRSALRNAFSHGGAGHSFAVVDRLTQPAEFLRLVYARKGQCAGNGTFPRDSVGGA